MKNKTRNAQWYRDKIEKIANGLPQDDRDYIDKLQTYMSLASTAYDEDALMSSVYNLVQDLKDAVADGVHASEFFGKEPQKLGDELIEASPRASWRARLDIILPAIGIIWAIGLFFDGTAKGAMRVNIGSHLASTVLMLVGIFALFAVLKRTIYRNERKLNLGIGAILFLIIGALTLIQLFFPPVWVVTVPYPVDILLLGVIGVAAIVAILKVGGPIFYGGIAVLLATGIDIAVKRLAFANGTPLSRTTEIILSGISILGWVIFVLVSAWVARSEEKENE